MIIGFELYQQKCSNLNAIFNVVKINFRSKFMKLGYLSIPLSFSPENFKKIWSGPL